MQHNQMLHAAPALPAAHNPLPATRNPLPAAHTLTTPQEHYAIHTNANLQINATLEDVNKSSNNEFPTLLGNSQLPGPMCMKKLSQLGVFNQLSAQSGYTQSLALSTKGRGKIISNLIPEESIVCSFTAAWVWLGGTFPVNIDIINYSNCRKKPHDHTIRSFRRQLSDEDYVVIGDVRVTTPERTICDLAYTPSENEYYEPYRKNVAHSLIERYCIDLNNCIRILNANPYFPGSVRAREWIHHLKEEMRTT